MRQPRGIALVVTLAILVAVALLAFATSITTMISQWSARNDRGATEAYYVAETGLQQWKTLLFQAYRWQLYQTIDRAAGSRTPTRSECGNVLAGGVDWNRNGTIESNETLPATRTGTVPMGAGVGTYTITIAQDPTRPRFMLVRSVGRYGGSQAIAQATFDLSNTGPWNYAIFSGRGASNKHLNGGAIVRGGLYVQGDPGNPDKEVIGSTGNFAMLNEYNYSSDAVLSNRLNSDMRSLSNLCATLRVQYGRVEVSGSSSYGTPNNKLLGAYVGDSVNDIYGNTSDVCANNRGICTDDRGAFDLPPPLAPRFPEFNTTPCTSDPSRTWAACVRDEAATGGLRITSSAVLFPVGAIPTSPLSCLLGNLLNGGELRFGGSSVDCRYTLNGKTGGFRYVSGNPGMLEIYGTLHTSGIDVRFSNAINYRAFNFADPTERNASIFVEGGSIYIQGDLLPDASSATFPDQVLGLLAQNNIEQLTNNAMGIFYAGNRFRTQQGQRTLGTVVSNEFCTTSAGGNQCNAGQQAEVTYIPTMGNIPVAARIPEDTVIASFKVMSYERR
ncbi:pilus assembly PilX family protein [Meiothermus ruber]|uniref:Type 4 fimbrial biogenesis protein PilX N-terminal domain-containing protein n=1 Tax=Meiothermus ruber (strain ATCC 35948 / DSM 1279 / VKM B-1258 / 21) TaxID=504728 RepID=A0A806D6P4_MEIRD|nr:pilus assembly PilX N-terminal domain-containing protein [Meiothermus ruber]ADD27416.1 hypothetical protein Mrub_0649 [Meiothermus ruber DSM 1279]MCL6530536.1 pilus assembly PilX N-terminal domain-containing protein [Meiothermus ruber]GIW39205.1 MAG: hypothetical protein KatS3mg075_686 [Meiothermus sp.]